MYTAILVIKGDLLSWPFFLCTVATTALGATRASVEDVSKISYGLGICIVLHRWRVVPVPRLPG